MLPSFARGATAPRGAFGFFCAVLLLVLTCLSSTASAGGHTNNWAVLVGTSRFWFNYRHLANVLSMYRTVKRLGIPDSQIIMMLSDDVACNPRNAFPGTVYNNADRALDLYGDNIEVDYRGYEVTVENFIRLLTDRVALDTPRSKRLLTDDRSNIFIYMTGHGGNEFLKFQDAEEISAFDLADAFEQMWEKKRYHEMLFMIDTCQANTMYSKFYSPNIIATGSSEINQSSYSHHGDQDVGVAVIDRYTYYNLEYLEKNVQPNSKHTLKELFDSYDNDLIKSSPGIRTDLFKRKLDEVLITDFFGNVQNVEVDGDGLRGREDLIALSRLAANLTAWYRPDRECDRRSVKKDMKKGMKKEAKKEGVKRDEEKKVIQSGGFNGEAIQTQKKKRVGAMRVEEKDLWGRTAIGGGALVACAFAWAVSSVL
ncbi:peptidase C13 family-domain-containing protein [Terfezia claveryi]|nr:peptidase C13 family-domain-containing protein [Terfezia claveryi]